MFELNEIQNFFLNTKKKTIINIYESLKVRKGDNLTKNKNQMSNK